MAKKKKNNNVLRSGAVNLLLLHLLRRKIVQKEQEKAEKLAQKGKKSGILSARAALPYLLMFRMIGGSPARVKIKTEKNKDGKTAVKKVALVPKRKGIGRAAASLALKGLNSKVRRKRFGIL